MKNIFLYVGIIGVMAFVGTSSVDAAVCTDLSADLSSKSSGASVTKLQAFLKEAGYLSVAPNGNFGPSTLAAVKAFQAASGISATGTVGPATRTAILIKSCAPKTTPPPAPATTTAPTQTNTSSTANNSALSRTNTFTSPRSGETLNIGKTYVLSWTRDLVSNESLILENDKGIALGSIISDTTGLSTFTWKIGRVHSTQTGGDITVPPGLYKLHIRGASSGVDILSGPFTIAMPAITVSTVVPTTILAGDDNAVVLYGTGFTSTMFIYLDGYRNTSLNRLYVSPDGRVLVFSLPSSVPPGAHYITLKNGYEVINNATSIMVAAQAQ